MFFFLAKLAWSALAPTTALLVIGGLGLIFVATKRPRIGLRLVASAVLLLIAAASLPIGDWLLRPLEQRFPPVAELPGPVAGIILLGGATRTPASPSGRAEPSEAVDRVFAAARLAKLSPSARVIVSSGQGDKHAAGPEADVLAALLVELGVPAKRIELERRSRDTFENAQYSLGIAKPRAGERWLLVTSAFHMPRAIGCFRRVGFSVEAAPADWRVDRGDFPLSLPSSNNLAKLDFAAKEYVGLLAYRLRGRTTALLPAP